MKSLNDVTTILHMLQYLKDKVPPQQWDETPLPVIAAPRWWMRQLAVEFCGDHMDDEHEIEPSRIHGCEIVCQDELDAPVMIDHDGRVYPIARGWAASTAGLQPNAPSAIQ